MRNLVVLLLVSLFWLSGCINVTLIPQPGPVHEVEVGGTGEGKILVVEISGLISEDRPPGFWERPDLIARVKEQLTRAADDPDVRALVLRINSPGGTVTASDILYHELKQFREERKIPIVASLMDLGTSGGYYVAAAADKIVAHPSSVTGSLGVIMLTVDTSGLLKKIGVDTTAIASGSKKDMGSPFRPITAEEREIFEGVIHDFFERFVEVIEQGRPNLTRDQITALADGRIFSGSQAKQQGLVDMVGYLQDAVDLAKQEAGLEEARVVMYRRPGEYRQNIYSRWMGEGGIAGFSSSDLQRLFPFLRAGVPQFLYLWMP